MAPNESDHANQGTHEPKREQFGLTPNSENHVDVDNAPQKEFAELCSNPFPELAFDPDSLPEPLVVGGGNNNTNASDQANSPLTDGDHNDNASTRPVIAPDASDVRGPAIVYAEPDRSWIAKHKSWVITGLIVTVIITIGVAVGAVMVEKAKNGGGSGDSATSTSTAQVSSFLTASGATRTSSTDATTTSMPAGSSFSSTSTPSACTDTSNILTKVSWMGIADITGGWSVTYASATSATSCCVYCYQSTPRGCDAWAWMPDDSSGSIITACNIISGWNGTHADDTCPMGYTSVYFSQAGTNVSHVGAPGPCATVSSS